MTQARIGGDQLVERKAALKRLLGHLRKDKPLVFADHMHQHGEALFRRVCEMDLEGMVAKLASGPYVTEREETTWRKILNPHYSQRVGREDLFERDRHREPAPGWQSCDLACGYCRGGVGESASRGWLMD